MARTKSARCEPSPQEASERATKGTDGGLTIQNLRMGRRPTAGKDPPVRQRDEGPVEWDEV